MDEQKRLFLAIGLSLVILLVWQYFFLPKRPPRQVKKPPKIEKPQAERRAPQPQPAAPAREAGPFRQEVRAKRVTVDLGPVEAIFTSRGAALEALLLKNYRNPDGSPLDLVLKKGGRERILPLQLELGSLSDKVNSALYEASTENLALTPERPQGSLTFRYGDGKGLSVLKRLTFHYNRYLIDVETEVIVPKGDLGGREYRVLWGPGLGKEKKIKGRGRGWYSEGPVSYVNGKRMEAKPEEGKPPIVHRGELSWTGLQNKYYLAAFIPREKLTESHIRKRDGTLTVGLSLPYARKASFSLYAGPKESDRLKRAGNNLSEAIDYGWFSFVAKPLLYLLKLFYSMVGNWGWAIVILTAFIRILFYPLTHKSMKSMQEMQKLQPKMKRIREIYKNDRQRMNQEMMALYREHKVNPMGGCLPMLLQIPVFFALYQVLLQTIELREAPFIWWIKDLSAQDPYHISTILMGLSMLLQQKLTPTGTDPAQAKMMLAMPIIFTLMFIIYPVPSGLVVYWLINNVLSIGQQLIMLRQGKLTVPAKG
ncbi:MAG: membrane protein insertase YidC [Nitrospinota bacterium]